MRAYIRIQTRFIARGMFWDKIELTFDFMHAEERIATHLRGILDLKVWSSFIIEKYSVAKTKFVPHLPRHLVLQCQRTQKPPINQRV